MTYLSGKEYLKHKMFGEVEVHNIHIPCELCQRGQFQSRMHFREEGLQELANSIKEAGRNYNPVIVRPKLFGKYEIIAGERRVRAAMLAGMDTVYAICGEFTDEQAATICVTENAQREDLNPIEEAEGVRRMIEDVEGMTHARAAQLLGKSRTYITNTLRLLTLDKFVRDYLIMGKISAGHAKAIAGLESRKQQQDICAKTARNNWSVRKVEEVVRKLSSPTLPEGTPELNPNRDVARMEEALSTETGHPCRIQFNAQSGGGKLTISFASTLTFDAILELLAPNLDIDAFKDETLEEEGA